jgi:hypothetical protein
MPTKLRERPKEEGGRSWVRPVVESESGRTGAAKPLPDSLVRGCGLVDAVHLQLCAEPPLASRASTLSNCGGGSGRGSASSQDYHHTSTRAQASTTRPRPLASSRRLRPSPLDQAPAPRPYAYTSPPVLPQWALVWVHAPVLPHCRVFRADGAEVARGGGPGEGVRARDGGWSAGPAGAAGRAFNARTRVGGGERAGARARATHTGEKRRDASVDGRIGGSRRKGSAGSRPGRRGSAAANTPKLLPTLASRARVLKGPRTRSEGTQAPMRARACVCVRVRAWVRVRSVLGCSSSAGLDASACSSAREVVRLYGGEGERRRCLSAELSFSICSHYTRPTNRTDSNIRMLRPWQRLGNYWRSHWDNSSPASLSLSLSLSLSVRLSRSISPDLLALLSRARLLWTKK